MSEPVQVYLGDGLYAAWTGWELTLYADRDGIRNWVVLEPEVWAALRQFMKTYERNQP